ncbi:MAG: hypothetical protein H6985_17725 [Pseudomonadales bacterium]|nr:hypothetical protein [Halioglobus sp.]MCP5131407.1 hypothetical protein [Pseudomonadales bacterium]
MQIIIHCGLDKAGSTAIQAHVALFRQWLLRNGVYLPMAGLSGFGHVALFRDLDEKNWQPLVEELAAAAAGDYTRCFLSYEGICSFDEQSLARIRDYLAGHEVTLLFYLREQAQIIQSGYLQGLKSAGSPISMAQLNGDHALLCSVNRDYMRMLQKFETVFTREAIAIRRYEPLEWPAGSIVWDLLAFLGCPPDDEITPSEQRQNTSLDMQAAAILNVFDSYGANPTARAELVEDLLWLIQKYPGGSKYFLDDSALRAIRDFYRASNAALAERYGVEFDYADCVATPTGRLEAAGTGAGVSYVQELAGLVRYSRWKGEAMDGPALAALLRHQRGWSRFEAWGVWSLGDISTITFRLPLSRFTGFEDVIILDFRGRYFGGNTSTEIWAGDEFIEDSDLRNAGVNIPLRLLDADRLVHLQLRHHAAVSPAELAIDKDRRRLAYGLQGLSYRLSTSC